MMTVFTLEKINNHLEDLFQVIKSDSEIFDYSHRDMLKKIIIKTRKEIKKYDRL